MLESYLTDLARRGGGVDHDRCQVVIEQAVAQQISPISALIEGGLVDEKVFLHQLAEDLGMEWRDDSLLTIPDELKQQVSVRLAVQHQFLPVRDDDGVASILCCDPFDMVARQEVSRCLNEHCRWAIAPRTKILNSLRENYGVGAETFEQILAEGGGMLNMEETLQETTHLDEDDSEASVSRFVNQIIREALDNGATDIHVEPLEDDLRIRFRVDGVLQEVPVPSQIKMLKATLISRLKIMANLDIAERRLPQDGRINLEQAGEAIDVRVATIPSVAGESISLRLLGRQNFSFQKLGLLSRDEAIVQEMIGLPNGIILLTGPTGCGKSTSLYTFLSSLNTKDRRIVTIEDPVEYKLPGVIQIAVKPEIDLTFANGLRSILRGDPNVIMVGEMRDFETAETAIRAALTGHLVFSTLHTNDAIGGITRLIDMGVEPFLVASSVRAFIAQRLVRVLCNQCKKPIDHAPDYLTSLGFQPPRDTVIYEAAGCEACRNTGYTGRTAVMEICRVTEEMQNLIADSRPASEMRKQALRDGMNSLRQAGFIKVEHGITTIEEVLRVTMEDHQSDEIEKALQGVKPVSA